MRKYAKRAVAKRVNFQGLDLAIEFPKGGKRPYKDDEGKQQFKTMHADYGEVRGTEGLDGDAVDVYVGPDETSDKVFVITQMTKGDWEKVDEEKCVLGVADAAAAKKLYLKHYNDPRFFGAIKEMSMQAFQKKLATHGTVGKKIAAAAAQITELNYLRIANGDPILLEHGVKFALDPQKPVEQRQGRNLLGAHPDVSAVEAVTAFGEAQPLGKVAYTMEEKLERLRRRRDPNYVKIETETEVTRDEQSGLGIPQSRVVGDPKDSKMRKAASLAAVELFTKQAAEASERAKRIANHVDNAGIGLLASPYVGAGLAKHLGKRKGVLGAVGRAGGAYAKAFPNKNRREIAGLALVSHAGTNAVAKGIDKALPGKKTAGLKVALVGAAIAAGAKKLTGRAAQAVQRGARTAATRTQEVVKGVSGAPKPPLAAKPPLPRGAKPPAPPAGAPSATAATPQARPIPAASTPAQAAAPVAAPAAPARVTPTGNRPLNIPAPPPSSASAAGGAMQPAVVPPIPPRAAGARVTGAQRKQQVANAAQATWQGTKAVGRGVRNAAVLGTAAAGLGVGAAGVAASKVLGAGGGYHDIATPGYAAPRVY